MLFGSPLHVDKVEQPSQEQVDALHAQLTERGITAPSPRDAFWGDQRTL